MPFSSKKLNMNKRVNLVVLYASYVYKMKMAFNPKQHTLYKILRCYYHTCCLKYVYTFSRKTTTFNSNLKDFLLFLYRLDDFKFEKLNFTNCIVTVDLRR